MEVNKNLKSVGMTTFVDYYYDRKDKTKENLITALERNKKNWAVSSVQAKASAMDNIFKNGFELEALLEIIKSKRTDLKAVVKRAKDILAREGSDEAITNQLKEDQKHTGTRLSTYRKTQTIFKKNLENAHGEKCAVTEITTPYLLIASHIIPWSNCTDEGKISADNGLLLTPIYDKLFDRHKIGFDENGKIVFSPQLSLSEIKQIKDLGVDENATLKIRLTDDLKKNLAEHLKEVVN